MLTSSTMPHTTSSNEWVWYKGGVERGGWSCCYSPTYSSIVGLSLALITLGSIVVERQILIDGTGDVLTIDTANQDLAVASGHDGQEERGREDLWVYNDNNNEEEEATTKEKATSVSSTK
jgi:hypothetical protein